MADVLVPATSARKGAIYCCVLSRSGWTLVVCWRMSSFPGFSYALRYCQLVRGSLMAGSTKEVRIKGDGVPYAEHRRQLTLVAVAAAILLSRR